MNDKKFFKTYCDDVKPKDDDDDNYNSNHHLHLIC